MDNKSEEWHKEFRFAGGYDYQQEWTDDIGWSLELIFLVIVEGFDRVI